MQYQEVGCVKVRFSGFDWFCLLYFIFFHSCASLFYAFKVTDFLQQGFWYDCTSNNTKR